MNASVGFAFEKRLKTSVAVKTAAGMTTTPPIAKPAINPPMNAPCCGLFVATRPSIRSSRSYRKGTNRRFNEPMEFPREKDGAGNACHLRGRHDRGSRNVAEELHGETIDAEEQAAEIQQPVLRQDAPAFDRQQNYK